MCNGFGAIVTQDAMYFCEPDMNGDVSHREILRRLGWSENSDAFIRRFVRIECSDWTMTSFRFDEIDTLPGWVDEDAIRAAVDQTLHRCDQALATYEAVRDPAWATYEAVCAPALAQMIAAFALIPGYVAA